MALQISILNAEDIDEDKTYSSDDSSTQYDFTADNVGVTVTGNITLSRSQKLFTFDVCYHRISDGNHDIHL